LRNAETNRRTSSEIKIQSFIGTVQDWRSTHRGAYRPQRS